MQRRRFLASTAAVSALGATAGTLGSGPANAAPDIDAADGRSGHGGHGRGVDTGLDVLVDSRFAALAGQKVGVLSNPTGVDAKYRHLVDLMHASGRVQLTAAFGPEHGFRGSAQAGGSEGTGIDARTGITVYDAYGASQAKWAELITQAGVDTVVFDIQDVGARFYTYIWTLYDSMVAAARLGKRYVVLDRPNPIGGRAYGPMMTTPFTSGVGKKEIVQQHGMTVGELARFYNGEFLPAEAGRPVELTVIKCRGWRRSEFAADTGVPWVLPSPNMPTPDTALVYPGTCMFEGVASITEGRGTTRPFELVGGLADDFDYHWVDRLAARDLPGVEFREAYFSPTAAGQKPDLLNKLCAGVEVKVVDPARFDPVRTGVAMLVEARKYPAFAWRADTWDAARPYWIDKLSGSTRLRTMIDAGADVADVVGAWSAELAAFDRRRRPYLLY
ncbi:exo-beta-N-acetylmuramidase NamZ domain-containing protein [Plantactinospora solaniradicis]|uniref:Exo-beta-N-acetylmuramidase NamZ domain-containing protein n=1 Tax=Plantactinospora solaniradicis TaxID=1723736 RepID=A0ABW1KJ86_9ACTN